MEHHLNSEGRKIQLEFSEFIDKCVDCFSSHDFLRDAEASLREMRECIVRPFNVAVFGRMKTGKSTLINALIGKELAITGVNEATATINVISYSSNPDHLNKYKVYWNDNTPEEFPLNTLQENWAGKTEDVLDRVKRTKYIQLFSDSKLLGLHEIIDTPGTGSVAKEHEDVAQKFIDASNVEGRKADALIYVFPPVGRESDEEALNVFKQGRLENSSPYNSVAVLHKWDDILYSECSYADILAKAERIYSLMSDVVAKVIPVSGPLALVAETASDEFISSLIEATRIGFSGVKPFLSRDEKWDRDPQRQKLRKMFKIPWASFRLLVRIVAENSFSNISDARREILKVSGISELRKFIDENFFKRSAMIRQNQTLARIESIRKQSDEIFNEKQETLEEDLKHLERLKNSESAQSSMFWINKKIEENSQLLEYLKNTAVAFGKFYINSQIKKRIDDFNNIELLLKSKILDEQQTHLILKIFTHIGGSDSQGIPTKEEANNAEILIAKIPRRISNRKFLDYIQQRITNYKSLYYK